MAGEMSKADLTKDGEWGLFVETAEILDVELHPFDVYQGPYLYYNGHKIWFSSAESQEWIHGVFDDTNDTFYPLPCNPYAFQNIDAEDLADFIKGVCK